MNKIIQLKEKIACSCNIKLIIFLRPKLLSCDLIVLNKCLMFANEAIGIFITRISFVNLLLNYSFYNKKEMGKNHG